MPEKIYKIRFRKHQLDNKPASDPARQSYPGIHCAAAATLDDEPKGVHRPETNRQQEDGDDKFEPLRHGVQNWEPGFQNPAKRDQTAARGCDRDRSDPVYGTEIPQKLFLTPLREREFS